MHPEREQVMGFRYVYFLVISSTSVGLGKTVYYPYVDGERADFASALWSDTVPVCNTMHGASALYRQAASCTARLWSRERMFIRSVMVPSSAVIENIPGASRILLGDFCKALVKDPDYPLAAAYGIPTEYISRIVDAMPRENPSQQEAIPAKKGRIRRLLR